MLLIDLNQVMIGALMLSLKGVAKTSEINEDMIRHIVINTLRSYVKQYKMKYGEVILCADSNHYWRKDVFPYYKGNRKKVREESGLDWSMIFDSLNKIKNELKENFPYKVMDVDGAEADDIIAVLVKSTQAPVLILSSDEDFVQLQFPEGNVEQFSPRLNQYISVEDPERFLMEHIIRGDSSDGIPNILSADNVFMIKERQKSITKEKLNKWLDMTIEEINNTPELASNFTRNRQLIDFNFIPNELIHKIMEEYHVPKVGTRQQMLNYMIEHQMKNLIPLADEF